MDQLHFTKTKYFVLSLPVPWCYCTALYFSLLFYGKVRGILTLFGTLLMTSMRKSFLWASVEQSVTPRGLEGRDG